MRKQPAEPWRLVNYFDALGAGFRGWVRLMADGTMQHGPKLAVWDRRGNPA